MPGFPDLPGRKAFGEKLDPIPVLNPRRDIAGNTFNLGWWQLAGCGLMVARAWALVGPTGTVLSAAEAWNPNQDITLHPKVVHQDTGRYVLVYQATAPNEDNVQRPIGFSAVEHVKPQAVALGWEGQGAFVSASAWVAVTSYNVGDVVANGGKLYYCTGAGTSAGSGGPTGTGTAITDNTATWCYLAAQSGAVLASILTARAGTLTDCTFFVSVR